LIILVVGEVEKICILDVSSRRVFRDGVILRSICILDCCVRISGVVHQSGTFCCALAIGAHYSRHRVGCIKVDREFLGRSANVERSGHNIISVVYFGTEASILRNNIFFVRYVRDPGGITVYGQRDCPVCIVEVSDKASQELDPDLKVDSFFLNSVSYCNIACISNGCFFGGRISRGDHGFLGVACRRDTIGFVTYDDTDWFHSIIQI
jgi:hypothetical protein